MTDWAAPNCPHDAEYDGLRQYANHQVEFAILDHIGKVIMRRTKDTIRDQIYAAVFEEVADMVWCANDK